MEDATKASTMDSGRTTTTYINKVIYGNEVLIDLTGDRAFVRHRTGNLCTSYIGCLSGKKFCCCRCSILCVYIEIAGTSDRCATFIVGYVS